MRVCGLLVLMVAGLAGCQQRAEAPTPAPSTAVSPRVSPSVAPSPPLSPVASLLGEWRVAGIDGQSLDEPYGLALTGADDELWWEPRCAGMARSYRIDGPAIAFEPVKINGSPPAPGSPPPPVCTIAVPLRLADVARALDAATFVGRTSANGVLISGGGRSVLLFSQ